MAAKLHKIRESFPRRPALSLSSVIGYASLTIKFMQKREKNWLNSSFSLIFAGGNKKFVRYTSGRCG
jgi:hypothetical protein